MRTILFLLFCALPSVALAQPSGITGSITISPVMAGPTRQGAPDAKPLPHAEFVVQQSAKTVATFETDAEGRFQSR